MESRPSQAKQLNMEENSLSVAPHTHTHTQAPILAFRQTQSLIRRRNVFVHRENCDNVFIKCYVADMLFPFKKS